LSRSRRRRRGEKINEETEGKTIIKKGKEEEDNN
jgi:hypothetical protein